MILRAALLNLPVGIWLFKNRVRVAGLALEAGSKSCCAGLLQTPPVKPAVQSAEKSPPRCASGMVCNWLTVEGWLKRDSVESAKKNNLFFTIGPAKTPPKLS